MRLTGQSPVDLPLLDSQEVSQCMQQGHHWNGHGLPWPIRETSQGRSGSYHSQYQGGGIDFAESRAYQPGDDPRHINWRAMARTGIPMVRLFHEEQSPTACFVVDRRASMRFGTRTRLKAAQAARLAIFLATWEARRGAEIGGLILNETFHWQAPTSGQTGINNLSRLVSAACPPLEATEHPDFNKALSLLAAQLPTGSHLYLLSDFYDLNEFSLPNLYRLGNEHRAWAISMHDKAEQELPRAGKLQLVWNHENQVSVDSNSATLGNSIRDHHRQRLEAISRLCARADIMHTSIAAHEDDLVQALRPDAL